MDTRISKDRLYGQLLTSNGLFYLILIAYVSSDYEWLKYGLVGFLGCDLASYLTLRRYPKIRSRILLPPLLLMFLWTILEYALHGSWLESLYLKIPLYVGVMMLILTYIYFKIQDLPDNLDTYYKETK